MYTLCPAAYRRFAIVVIALFATPAFASPIPQADPGDAARVSAWIVATHDNGALPFIVVDKVGARLMLFDAGGKLRADVPVLLGSARGDDSVPGIGTRKLAAIKPAERTTPAGRFVAQMGVNAAGQDTLWVDYDAAIALHRASDRKPGPSRKSRAERLQSPSAAARRASLGCIGVATRFFVDFVRPTFADAGGIVYILPETRAVTAEFHMPESGTMVAGGD
ncbi:L,D-transpeptidase [Polymorphobacter fuscus]|uniref:L,D-transpeptidase n=1 Tax=Sandarakinorhabdus fusca TaxID=1439888 RepID=A0A7C9LG50_9SPHN|nr:L,D-transpeptidase [Polymorphobacter fuscus]KAB7647894.1 murein L,D-transpeptidase [Polymorphobacter fuscus]MQT17207.1 L,D-transpeptidase [Polymorphobacter fuscus]NJC08799.1 hypothetical protein [Polymorphobacter fuscus]